MPETLAIVGASVRAAAFATLRSGRIPICADRFADLDLRRRAKAVQVDDYPDGVAAAIARERLDGWFYTGAIENYPDLVDKIAAVHPLLGTPGSALRGVRDPIRLAEEFLAAGVPCPAVAESSGTLPVDGSWLKKPRRGSGGGGISAWRGGPLPVADTRAEPSSSAFYFQQRIAGRPCSAVFVGAGGAAAVVGVTWQLVGAAWAGAAEFHYAGSLGPVRLSLALRTQLERIGGVLSGRFGLVGLFGVDAVVVGEAIWPIEVNPRYTASVEVLERALAFDSIGLHLAACRNGRLPDSAPEESDRWCGKAILYARRDLAVPPAFSRHAETAAAVWPWPDLADIPAPGSMIHARAPVVTVLAEATDEATVMHRLQTRAREIEDLLHS